MNKTKIKIGAILLLAVAVGIFGLSQIGNNVNTASPFTSHTIKLGGISLSANMMAFDSNSIPSWQAYGETATIQQMQNAGTYQKIGSTTTTTTIPNGG